MLQDLYSIKGKGSCPLSKDHTISQGFVPVQKCKRLDACVSKELRLQTRSSWQSLFGEYPTSCEEGKRFVIRNFLSNEECQILQDAFSNKMTSNQQHHPVRDIKGFEKVSMFDSVFDREGTCNEPWFRTYLNVSRRIEKILTAYFLPGLLKDVRLETDAINVFTHLSMQDNLKPDETSASRFVFPANAHCDSCTPRRVLLKYDETEGCVPRTRIDCDYASHSYPHRKLTTILYLSESVQLNRKQIEMSRVKETLHLPIENAVPRPRDRSTTKCFDEMSNYKKRVRFRGPEQFNEHLKSTITRQQRERYENKEFVSLGGGLCFVNYDDHDTVSRGSSTIECGNSRRDVETGCCERLIQTKCGDLVAFTSGGENPHAVMPTLAGNRLNIQTWWNVKDSAFRSCMNVMEMTEGVSDVCSGGRTKSMCIVGSGECARFVRSDCRETRHGKTRCMVRIKPYDRTESLLLRDGNTDECIQTCRLRRHCKSIAFRHDDHGGGECVLYYCDGGDDGEWTPAVMDYFVEHMAGFMCYALNC